MYMKKAEPDCQMDFYSSDIEKVLKVEFNYGSMMRTLKNMNYDNEVLICHGDDIVLSNGAYSGVNKPFKTLGAIGKISDSVYRQKLSLYGCDLDIYVFKTRSNIWSMLMHNAPIIVFLMLINVFFPLCLFSIFNHSFTSRILQLSKVFKSVDSEKLVSMTDRESKDEIGSMIKNYNRMVSRTNDLIQTVYKNKLKEQEMLVSQKNAELLALHSQINPHFLFNSLNAGAQLAMMEDAEQTGIFVEKMADFFRYNVKKGQEDATLGEELEAVDNYIYILNVRFAGDIHFSKEVDESLENVRMPSMILQPVVENAVNHGIRDIEWEGKIHLTVTGDADYIRISVKDNGKGMTQEQIEGVLSGNRERRNEEGDSTGIGMNNVISRLELYYERDGLMEIYSEGEGMGTEVVINIPLERSEKNVQNPDC